MHIAIVAPYADPEKGAAVVRVNSFRDTFKSAGHTVSVFAPKRAAETDGVVRYGSLLDLFRRLKSSRSDVIIGTSPPITHNIVSLAAGIVLHKPFVLDAKDPFTYLVSRFPRLRKGRLKMFAYRVIEYIVHKGASHIFVLTPRDKILLEKWYHLPSRRITVVWNGSDPVAIRRDPQKGRQVRKMLGIPQDAFVVVYAGVIGGKDLDVFFQSSKEAANSKTHFLLLFTHDGSVQADAAEAELRKGFEQYRERVHVVKNIPYSSLYSYLSAGNVALNPVPSFWETCLPTKTFDYLAAELPLLAKGPDGSLSDFCNEFDVGWFSSDWNGVDRALQFARTHPSVLKTKGKNGREAIQKKFTRQHFSEQALSIVEEL